MWLSNLKDQNGGIRRWNNLCEGKIVAAPGDMGRLTNQHVIPNPRIKWQCNSLDRVWTRSIRFSNSSTNRTKNWTYGSVQHKYKTLNWTKGLFLQKFGSNQSSEPKFDTTMHTSRNLVILCFYLNTNFQAERYLVYQSSTENTNRVCTPTVIRQLF
jgi:hypothetical protein